MPFPVLANILSIPHDPHWATPIHEQMTVARRTRYSDQPGCHLFMRWFRGLGLSKSVSLKDNQSAININRKRNVRQDSRLPCNSFHRFLEYPVWLNSVKLSSNKVEKL